VSRSLVLGAFLLLIACSPRAQVTPVVAGSQAAPVALVDPASLLVATTAIDLPDYEDIDLAADDRSVAAVIRARGTSALVVTDLVTHRTRTIATTPGRDVQLASGGAVRKDLVAYVEREDLDSETPRRVMWHVFVADVDGRSKELDAIPGEISDDPTANRWAPAPITNGHDVLWMRAPMVDGHLGNVQIVRWDGAGTSLVYRGQARYGIDDAGRIAIARPTGSSDALATWELMVIDGGPAKPVAHRSGGGAPYLFGTSIAWSRATYASSTIDIVDIASGAMRPITQQGCLSVGASLVVAVFLCDNHRSRIVPLDQRSVVDTASVFLRADPYAIIGRDLRDGRWTVTPVGY
jgi:hypothetical protein